MGVFLAVLVLCAAFIPWLDYQIVAVRFAITGLFFLVSYQSSKTLRAFEELSKSEATDYPRIYWLYLVMAPAIGGVSSYFIEHEWISYGLSLTCCLSTHWATRRAVRHGIFKGNKHDRTTA